METRAKAGTSEALKNLIGLQPTDLTVIREGKAIQNECLRSFARGNYLSQTGAKNPFRWHTNTGAILCG